MYLVQIGERVPRAKPLSSGVLHGLGIAEIREDHDTDTYRVVYVARFAQVVYVLHAFKKKSRHGIATPQHEIELIRSRYERAIQAYNREFGGWR